MKGFLSPPIKFLTTLTITLAWRFAVILSKTTVLGMPEVAEDCNDILTSLSGTDFKLAPKSLNTLTAIGGILFNSP